MIVKNVIWELCPQSNVIPMAVLLLRLLSLLILIENSRVFLVIQSLHSILRRLKSFLRAFCFLGELIERGILERLIQSRIYK